MNQRRERIATDDHIIDEPSNQMSSLVSSEVSKDESAASGISALKTQLDDLQRRLGRALRARAGTMEDDKDGGYVNVEFVRVSRVSILGDCRLDKDIIL